MAVPLFDITAQNAALAGELRATFDRLLASGQFILGREVADFERDAAAFLGTKHAIGVSSGTDALLLAMMALGIGPGDEVICPSFTFFATGGCVSRLGATPVFVDCCPETFNVRAADIEAAITPRTRAIIPVHLFGRSADLPGIIDLAKARGLAVIEDAAQAIGATCQGQPVGTWGEFGAYSFFPTKNLGAFGDAGLLVTNDDALAEKAVILRLHGMQPKYYHRHIGGNFRIDALQAALLRVKLPHLGAYTESRRRHAAHYQERLSTVPGISAENDADARIVLPLSTCESDPGIWNQYTLRVRGAGQRDGLKSALAARGIGSEIYYPLGLHQQECFAAAVAGRQAPLPVTEQLCGEVLSLPIFPELEKSQVDEVIDAIREFVGSAGA